MHWFYVLARSICWAALSCVFSIQYIGVDCIPQDRGRYLVASNHTCYLDPIFLALPVRPWIRFVAKDDLMKNPFGKALFSMLGILPVARGSGDRTMLERCATLGEEGAVIGIFPEGTRHPQDEPGRPKSGMAVIAQMAGAAVLPCCVRYEKPLRWRSRVYVRYGELIPFEKLGIEPESARSLHSSTKRVWGIILQMLEEAKDDAQAGNC